jgi:hypothetical protein
MWKMVYLLAQNYLRSIDSSDEEVDIGLAHATLDIGTIG